MPHSSPFCNVPSVSKLEASTKYRGTNSQKEVMGEDYCHTAVLCCDGLVCHNIFKSCTNSTLWWSPYCLLLLYFLQHLIHTHLQANKIVFTRDEMGYFSPNKIAKEKPPVFQSAHKIISLLNKVGMSWSKHYRRISLFVYLYHKCLQSW